MNIERNEKREMIRVTMRKPDDFHAHLREGEMLKRVLPFTAKQFARGLVMPNTTQPILNAIDVRRYRYEITSAVSGIRGGEKFSPLMTIKIVQSTTPETVRIAKEVHAIAGKIYPVGVTTNSDDGVYDFKALESVFEAMEDAGMILCLHGEAPAPIFCLDREVEFLKTLEWLIGRFPKLRIVLEHVTTRAACEFVRSAPSNVAATVTIHHLLLTLDDVVGGMLKPHHFCKPLAKYPKDREALLREVFEGNRVFLGTDTAPHTRSKKECADGCAGIFSAPVALPLIVELFEHWEILPKLEDFASRQGALFYGLPLNEEKIVLVKKPWVVPLEYEGVVPFKAGETLKWQVQDDE